MQQLLLQLLLLLLLELQFAASSQPPAIRNCYSLNRTYVTLSGNDCSRTGGFEIRVSEEIPEGTNLMEIQAMDPENDRVTMSLIGRGLATYYFALLSSPENRSAVLRASSRLDADTLLGLTIQLRIQLDDGNLNVLTQNFPLLIVIDQNDNLPEFLGLPYRWEIPENSIPNGNINFTVRVIDRDRGSSSMSVEFKEQTTTGITKQLSMTAMAQQKYCPSGSSSPCFGQQFTRTLQLLEALDYETSSFYQISVNATDLTEGGQSTITDVIINVIDQQDTPPFFEGVPYASSVMENTPAGTAILTVSAKDGDRGSPNAVTYHLNGSSPFAKFFNLNSSSGKLILSNVTLDRESPEVRAAFGNIEFSVTARENSSVSQPANLSETSATVRIVVADVNDFRPQFSNDTISASVLENSQQNSPITVEHGFSVFDYDAGSNGYFNLSVYENGTPSSNFSVLPSLVAGEAAVTLRVGARAKLDFERQSVITFMLVAMETQTAENFASTATVSLTILDANDNRPVFNQSRFAFAVPENSARGTFVGRVEAADADTGLFGSISYSIAGTDADKFTINSTTGEILVNVDADKNLTLLDREKFATLFLTLQATDGGGFVTSVQLELQLEDRNDVSPQFTRQIYQVFVRENAVGFDSVVTVEAIDLDASSSNNSLISYSLHASSPEHLAALAHFNISSSTGRLGIQRPIDAEQLNSSVVNLTVVAADSGNPSLNASATLLVTVIDVNDNAPSCTQALFSATVKENATSGERILQLNATDADAAGSENSRLFFRVDSGAADKFSVDGTTGWVSVERGADLDVFRYGSSYNLSISVFDRGSPQLSGSCTAAITVQDVNNQRPYFDTVLRRESISEDAAVNATLRISPPYVARDPDTNARLQYQLLTDQMTAIGTSGQAVPASEYNFTRLFGIDASNGALLLLLPLDRERAEEIRLLIFVRDLGAETPLPEQTATGTLVLTIADVNDEAPVFQPPAVNATYRLAVLESVLPPADVSLKAVAVDADRSATALVYSISPVNAFFSIDAATGQVSLKSALDRETRPEHTFFIVANDSVHASTATVSVQVTDANDNEPTFTQFNDTTVWENATVGQLVARVQATDRDAAAFGEVRYGLLTTTSSFRINATTGEIFVAAVLDRDAPGGDSHSLVVEAFDNPGGSDSRKSSRTLIVTVADVNDNPPVFAQGNISVSSLLESLPAGQLLREVAASDADAGANREISFSLAAVSGDALRLFGVETRRSGEAFAAGIVTRTSLKDAVGQHVALLLAADAGQPSLTATATVVFDVVDVNDNSPTFLFPNVSETVVQVNESTNTSSSVGEVLLVARAIDRDVGNNSLIRFSLASSSDEHLAFSIDAVNGSLSVAAFLDREVKARYRFQIVAADMGERSLSSMVAVVVEVMDIDESPPVFSGAARRQQLQLPENLAPAGVVPGLNISGAFVGNVARAADPDSTAASSAVCYFLLDRVYTQFYLNKTTGDLFAIASFDREEQGQHVLHLLAVSEPQCNTGEYEWVNAPGRSRRSLDASPVTFDPNNPAMATVTVTISDTNDNAPKWTESQFYGGVSVDQPPLTEILNFAEVVSDADSGNNSRLNFSITQPQANAAALQQQLRQRGVAATVLRIDSSSGVLSTGADVYFEAGMTGSLTFNVTAGDGVFVAEAKCTIYLLSISQQIIVTFGEETKNVSSLRASFVNYLSNVTGWRIVVNNVVTHKREDGTADDTKTDMYIHAIDPSDSSIIPASDLRDRIDLLWPQMRALYSDYRVLWAKLAATSPASDGTLEILRIALIAVACGLTVLLFFSCVSLWSCRRMYRRKLKAATAVAFGPNGQSNTLRLPGTNIHAYEGSNPIWLESYDAAHDNRAFESDKDSIDNNDINPSLIKQSKTFAEQEKSLEFFNDDASDTGSQQRRRGLAGEEEEEKEDVLATAVAAGPTLSTGNGTAVTHQMLRDLAATNI